MAAANTRVARYDPILDGYIERKLQSRGGVPALLPTGSRISRRQTFNGPDNIRRYCPECDKPLSKYNPGPTCYAHKPTKYPVNRGRNAA